MSISSEKIRNTVHTTAVASELVAAVVMNIAGNDISNQLNNSPVTRKLVSQMAVSQIRSNLKVSG